MYTSDRFMNSMMTCFGTFTMQSGWKPGGCEGRSPRIKNLFFRTTCGSLTGPVRWNYILFYGNSLGTIIQIFRERMDVGKCPTVVFSVFQFIKQGINNVLLFR